MVPIRVMRRILRPVSPLLPVFRIFPMIFSKSLAFIRPFSTTQFPSSSGTLLTAQSTSDVTNPITESKLMREQGTISIEHYSPALKLTQRKIRAPLLSDKHLGDRILCYRPVREGSPVMATREQDGRLIGDNYGHGGSGWTLGPGAAKYVVDKLVKEMDSHFLPKDTPTAIIGAGALGLFTALELQARKFQKITVVAESFDNLTSHNAGGLLAPVSMDNDPEMQKLIDVIGIDAYLFYKNLAQGKNPLLKQGAEIVPAYFDTKDDSGLEPYVGHVMQPAKEVRLDFMNGTFRNMVAYDDGIFLDTGALMTSLRQAIKGVRFEQRKLNSLSDRIEKIVLNCTGLGAKTLAKDDKVYPVQGHLVMLKDQNPEGFRHMILSYGAKAVTKAGFNVKRSFYQFDKRKPGSPACDVGVIGGTFIEKAGPDTPNLEEFDIMIEGARKFYGQRKSMIFKTPYRE